MHFRYIQCQFFLSNMYDFNDLKFMIFLIFKPTISYQISTLFLKVKISCVNPHYKIDGFYSCLSLDAPPILDFFMIATEIFPLNPEFFKNSYLLGTLLQHFSLISLKIYLLCQKGIIHGIAVFYTNNHKGQTKLYSHTCI